MLSLKEKILKALNMIIPESPNKLFVSPLYNCSIDKYDLINYESDSSLSFINYMMKHYKGKKITIYLLVYHMDRIPLYKKYTCGCNYIDFDFVPSVVCTSKWKRFFQKTKNIIIKFTCTFWITDSPASVYPYTIRRQKQISLGYATSCKSDFIFDTKSSAIIRFSCTSNNTIILSTSYIDSIMKSAAYGLHMNCFLEYGMPRNDLLGNGIISKKAKEWLDIKKFSKDTKVILYAPTFRDYESMTDVQSRSIWGVNYDDRLICDYLRKNNIIVIAKLHSWQNKSAILQNNDSVIMYEPTFDFSFYDLFKLSDIMITDYSSIGLDWLFMNKPLIYNLWDYEVYHKERGFAYEPYEDLCGGEIVKNTNELIKAIQTALEVDLYSEKRARIKNVMYSVQDYSSSEKAYNLLLSFLNDGKK